MDFFSNLKKTVENFLKRYIIKYRQKFVDFKGFVKHLVQEPTHKPKLITSIEQILCTVSFNYI